MSACARVTRRGRTRCAILIHLHHMHPSITPLPSVLSLPAPLSTQNVNEEPKVSAAASLSELPAEMQAQLHQFAMHFRGGMLASVLRAEAGSVFVPPPTEAQQEEQGEADSEDPDGFGWSSCSAHSHDSWDESSSDGAPQQPRARRDPGTPASRPRQHVDPLSARATQGPAVLGLLPEVEGNQ